MRNLGISDRMAPLLGEVRQFIATEVLPVEEEFFREIAVRDRWQFTDRQLDILDDVKGKLRSRLAGCYSVRNPVGQHYIAG